MKLKLLFGFPGWGWKMYGLASLSSGRMWFIGFSKQLPFFQPQELKYPDVAATAATMRDTVAQLDTMTGTDRH